MFIKTLQMKKIILLIGLLCTVNSFSQNDLFIGQTRFMQKSNASYLGSSAFNVSSLIFEDQLNRSTGFISTETADPLANRLL